MSKQVIKRKQKASPVVKRLKRRDWKPTHYTWKVKAITTKKC